MMRRESSVDQFALRSYLIQYHDAMWSPGKNTLGLAGFSLDSSDDHKLGYCSGIVPDFKILQ